MAPENTTSSQEINTSPKSPAPRQGWEEQYQRMAESGDDALLDGDILSLTEWDETKWEW